MPTAVGELRWDCQPQPVVFLHVVSPYAWVPHSMEAGFQEAGSRNCPSSSGLVSAVQVGHFPCILWSVTIIRTAQIQEEKKQALPTKMRRDVHAQVVEE